ncbi:bacterial extracellular solute-binding protein, family 5 [Escherichia coli]|nr:bacterial extracellular solute-binding protein, family 5 [Escherichia coli]
MMEQALETGKQQDVLELAQLAPGELRTLLQPFMADNGKTIHPRCVFPTIARSNRYNQAFCPAVPSSISPADIFRPDPLR